MKKVFWAATVLAISAAAFAVLAFAGDNDQAKSETTSAAAISPAAYPLDVCIVSGEKLGEMGDPVVKTIDGREVKFCCNMCPAKYEKDKAKYSKKLDDAIIAAEKPNYPVETCVVSGEPLVHSDMGDPVDYVYQNQLVRFCCNNCVKAFNKNPERFLEKLSAARAAKAAPAEPTEQK